MSYEISRSTTADVPLLQVLDLSVELATKWGVVRAVQDVSFTLRRGETLGIVGESGSGKTMTCLALLRLLPAPAGRIMGGRILFEGRDLLPLKEKEMREYRGRRISMILQDPLTSLNPVFTVGEQVSEPLRVHHLAPLRELRERAVDLLRSVRIPTPEARVGQYPHQFSGGMRQRVAGAIGLAPEPKLLIADEPTTSLDVTIQLQILKLLKEIQRETGLAIIFVSHDMSLIARMCDRVAVMYAGRLVEEGPVAHILESPSHPYTEALVQSLPQLDERLARLPSIEGEPPDMANPPAGCAFSPRCPKAMSICGIETPPTVAMEAVSGRVACWLHAEREAISTAGASEEGASV